MTHEPQKPTKILFCFLNLLIHKKENDQEIQEIKENVK